MNTQKTVTAEAVTTRLGRHDEIVVRFADFARFWRENPVSGRYALQAAAREILPKERVKKCCRARINRGDPVDVWKANSTPSAHYGNLQVCGSIWVCPVCASKVATRRREELTAAIDTWTGDGNSVLLPTFTMQHFARDPCADVLKAIGKAHGVFWAGRQGQALINRYAIAGKVRGLEVTYTANGWHWHFHILLFVRGKVPPNRIDAMREDMSNHWRHAVHKAGKYADGVHGVDLRNTDRDVADYVSKFGKEGEGTWRQEAESWTEAHELALATIKRAGKSGKTPFQLLALALAGDSFAKKLFAEYAAAVKGKRQLHWSKGLRAMLGLTAEKSDEEMALAKEEPSTLLARLDVEHWQVILANDARGELLKVASTGNPWALVDFLEGFGLNDVHYPVLANDPGYYGEGCL